MRWLILLPVYSYSQCIGDAYCNDNLACTQDICFLGYCNQIPLNDSCFQYLCQSAGHCKVHPYLLDSCGCTTIMGYPDSVRWSLDGVYIGTEDTMCFNSTTGVHLIRADAYWGSYTAFRNKISYFYQCECETNQDCDDQNDCTIDQCYLGECRNQKAHSSLSSITLSEWGQRCCCH